MRKQKNAKLAKLAKNTKKKIKFKKHSHFGNVFNILPNLISIFIIYYHTLTNIIQIYYIYYNVHSANINITIAIDIRKQYPRSFYCYYLLSMLFMIGVAILLDTINGIINNALTVSYIVIILLIYFTLRQPKFWHDNM